MEWFFQALPAIISTVVVGLLGYLIKQLKNFLREYRHDKEVSEKVLMWQLRAVIWQPYYSYEEKCVAFEEYKARGGNHLTEEHFRQIEAEKIKEANKIA